MEELRISFIVGGAVAIIAVLCHGLWSIRKRHQAEKYQELDQNALSDRADDVTIDEDDPLLHDDDVELVMLSGEEYERTQKDEPSLSLDDEPLNAPLNEESRHRSNGNDTLSSLSDAHLPESNVSVSNITEPKVDVEPERVEDNDAAMLKSNASSTFSTPHMHNEQITNIPEPPASLMKSITALETEETEEAGAKEITAEKEDTGVKSEKGSASKSDSDSVNLKTQAKNLVKKKVIGKKSPEVKSRQEPSLGSDQIRIDFDSESAHLSDQKMPLDTVEDTEVQEAPEQEVLVLNVRMDDGDGISGAALLPMLLTLGFKFGDQDIFHRHVNSNGKGPVLFSLANMFKPGVFDIDNLENFTTQGISLFMILPIEGDAHQVFNMMHNAARKIADEFGGKVLDGRRSALNKQSLQQYVEKIREFERKRMIRR